MNAVAKKISRKYAVFDKMLEGVQVINFDWYYIYVNKSLTKYGRTTKENLLGYKFMDAHPGVEQRPVFKHIKQCMDDRVPSQIDNMYEFPDKSVRWFDLRIEPVPEGVLIMSFEITARKQTEAKLKAMNEEMEGMLKERTKELEVSLEREKELNKMKSQFVSIASHELRTPLSMIVFSTSLIEKFTRETDAAKCIMQIEKIKSAVKHMETTLNDFLMFDKLEDGKIKVKKDSFDLKQFMQGIKEEFEGITKKNQRIKYAHDGTVDIALDKQILYNIMLNLISNAIKYSEKDIEIHTRVEKEIIFISVKDRGIGIPKDEQQNLFERFFRAKNAADIEGTGLGLNIVKLYIDLLGGTITCISNENEGTTFAIYLNRDY